MRRYVPALSLLGSLLLLAGCSSNASRDSLAPARTTAGPDLEAALEVVRLQHVDAAEIAEVVSDLIATAGASSPRVVADTRLNALVLYGDSVERAQVRDLLTALDRPPQR